jgi:hypothetical protein
MKIVISLVAAVVAFALSGCGVAYQQHRSRLTNWVRACCPRNDVPPCGLDMLPWACS